MIEEAFDAAEAQVSGRRHVPASAGDEHNDPTPEIGEAVLLTFVTGIASPAGTLPLKVYRTSLDPATAVQFAAAIVSAAEELKGSGKVAIAQNMGQAAQVARAAQQADGLRT